MALHDGGRYRREAVLSEVRQGVDERGVLRLHRRIAVLRHARRGRRGQGAGAYGGKAMVGLPPTHQAYRTPVQPSSPGCTPPTGDQSSSVAVPVALNPPTPSTVGQALDTKRSCEKVSWKKELPGRLSRQLFPRICMQGRPSQSPHPVCLLPVVLITFPPQSGGVPTIQFSSTTPEGSLPLLQNTSE